VGKDESGDSGDSCDPNLYNYETVGLPYTWSWCVPCHSADLAEGQERAEAPVDVNFNTYADLIQDLDKIEAWALGVEPSMPPAGGPTEEALALFTHWIECGAQE
jgi:uncharacterized membrane protein